MCNVDDRFGSVSQNEGIVITLHFVYLVNKSVYYAPTWQKLCSYNINQFIFSVQNRTKQIFVEF